MYNQLNLILNNIILSAVKKKGIINKKIINLLKENFFFNFFKH